MKFRNKSFIEKNFLCIFKENMLFLIAVIGLRTDITNITYKYFDQNLLITLMLFFTHHTKKHSFACTLEHLL